MSLTRARWALVFGLLFLASQVNAQLWSSFLSAPGSCGPTNTATPGVCGYDWAGSTGIPGGIPSGSWTQSGSTITSTGSDQTSAIQTALNACSGNKYVLLATGTFITSGNLSIPGGCVLRGGGANNTIIQFTTTSTITAVTLGTGGPSFGSATAVSSCSAGTTSCTVASTSGLSIGSYIAIDQLNDGTTVYVAGTQGNNCTWCDGNETNNGSRAQGQIEKITNITGNVLTLEMPLMVSYTLTPHAFPVSMITNAGLENLQIYAVDKQNAPAQNTPQIHMSGCAYCWVHGVEGNYAASDHIDVDWSYRGEISNNYFSNSYIHNAGCCDSMIGIRTKVSGFWVVNNILERLHSTILIEWGAAGNVFAYNFSTANFTADTSSANYTQQDINFHGAHPQFNLFEGNVSNTMGQDGIWGTAANNTVFRNWAWGTSMICEDESGNTIIDNTRAAVVCSPFGVYAGSGVNSYLSGQAAKAFDVNYPTTNYNMIGNVEGSSQQQTLGTGHALAIAQCGGTGAPGGTPCGANSRIYQGAFYNEAFGYGSTGDSGSQAQDSYVAWNTAFIHGEYSTVANAITWSGAITHTLPSSFYLSAQPNWWTSTIPFPAIGPDVTGGTGPGGHTYSTTASNPAMNCYFNVMGGTLGGAGSPYTFNAATCYPTSGSPGFSVSPGTIPATHSGNIVFTLTGNGNTAWVSGTVFSVSALTGLTKVSQTVNVGAQTATLTVTTGSGTGTVTVSDSTDSATSTFTVATATLSISPNSGTTSTTPTLTLTGTNTLWTTETAASLFTVAGAGCSGESIATPTVATNTSATAVLTVGSGACTETITDTSTTATASFTASAATATPTVTTGTSSALTATTALISTNSFVCTGTCPTVTAEGVACGTSSNPTTNCGIATPNTSPFNVNLAGLTALTAYHFRAYATNSAGTAYGSDQTFTTTNCNAVAIGPFTLCGAASNALGGSHTSVTQAYSPAVGNGLELFVFICGSTVDANLNCNSATPTSTVTISDNINNPEPCFTASPHSPFLSNNVTIPDIIRLWVFYSPDGCLPSGVTSFTATFGSTGYYPQIEPVEWQAGSIATANFFDAGDTVAFGISSGSASISTSGSTLNPNDLITVMTQTCGGNVPQVVGIGYTAILVNSAEAGHIVEAQAALQTGVQTATSTWSHVAPAGCANNLGGINDSWFAVIVPLVGQINPPTPFPAILAGQITQSGGISR